MSMSQKKVEDLSDARQFLADVSDRLEIDPAIIEEAMPYLLGMTKRVAHKAVRPAAPLTAFLIGVASAGSQEKLLENLKKIDDAIDAWQGENQLFQDAA